MRLIALLWLFSTVDAGSPATYARRVRDLPKSGAGHQVGTCARPCPDGQQCVQVEVHCMRAPCPPIEECMIP